MPSTVRTVDVLYMCLCVKPGHLVSWRPAAEIMKCGSKYAHPRIDKAYLFGLKLLHVEYNKHH